MDSDSPALYGGAQTITGETRVGILMVRCGATGKDFPTGIETDRLSFELTPAFNGTIRCPLCAVDHPWSKIDAWVCESDDASSGIAA
jgi:hypothetical protein